MSRYRFEVATPDDDAELRRVLAATPMEGHISIGFRREPSWFAAAVVDGRFRQVIACRDRADGRILAFGCRSVRDVYVNGCPAPAGYLSNLRVLPEHRRRGIVPRGYAFLRELHRDGRAPFYLTTIAAGNQTALQTLTAGRAGLPAYHAAGEYHTIAIPMPQQGKLSPPPAGTVIRPALSEDLPAVLDFLATVGPRRQFFPCYQEADFHSSEGALRDLALDRLLLAERNGRLVGTLAAWDQQAFRQNVVHGYGGWLGWARPVVNLWARLRGRAGLPAPGESLRLLVAALPMVADDDPGVFAALLEALLARMAAGPWTHLLIGLHERDPLLEVARRHQAAAYTTYLYLVCWDDGEAGLAGLDGRVPYLELGSL
jgi:hypothetical protein